MTIDVEDYFQVQAFASLVDRSTWSHFPSRVEANTMSILGQFDQAGVKATFFTLGWVAERFPQLVRQIVANGHELASHGYAHELVHTLTPQRFKGDLIRAKGLLEDKGGVGVQGYRAPTFSMGPRTPWAYDMLAETGHRYSSSVYPVRHDLYGAPEASRMPHWPDSGAIVELPMTSLKIGSKTIPISGGGYFRLAPYWLYRRLLNSYQRQENRPNIFYLHPWEIDAGQPRMDKADRLSKFRHYVNIPRVPGRMKRLLQDFNWSRMDRVFASEIASAAK